MGWQRCLLMGDLFSVCECVRLGFLLLCDGFASIGVFELFEICFLEGIGKVSI